MYKMYTSWYDDKDGENDLVLPSLGTASCLALVRGNLLRDYKRGICLTKFLIKFKLI